MFLKFDVHTCNTQTRTQKYVRIIHVELDKRSKINSPESMTFHLDLCLMLIRRLSIFAGVASHTTRSPADRIKGHPQLDFFICLCSDSISHRVSTLIGMTSRRAYPDLRVIYLFRRSQ